MSRSRAPQRTPRLLVGAGGALAAGAGFLALLGWAFERPFLASLGSGRIPMAPSTAALFALYGLAVVLRAQVPLRRGAYRIGMVVNSAGALVALVLFFLSLLGIRPEAEHLGFPAAGTVDGASVGHMSPVTAAGFLLASLSFLASLPSQTSRPWRARSAWGTAFLLIAVFAVLLLAYLYGTPFFYTGAFIPPAATTSVAFAALGTALLVLAGQQAGPPGSTAETPAWVPYPLVLVFLLLTAGLVTVGGLFFRKSGALYRYTGRTSVGWDAAVSRERGRFLSWLRQQRSQWILASGLDIREPYALSAHLSANCRSLAVAAEFPPRTFIFELRDRIADAESERSCAAAAQYRALHPLREQPLR